MTLLFTVCLVLSLVLALLFGALSLRLHRADIARDGRLHEEQRALVTPFHLLMVGVLVAAVFLLFPIYYTESDPAVPTPLRGAQGFFLAFYSALRLFILEGEYDVVIAGLTSCSGPLASVYSMYATVLFVAAPLMTAGFVLSFFKDTRALLAYRLRPHADIYLMSELNERSLSLAYDIMTVPRKGNRPLVVFADVLETEEDDRVEMIARARQLRALCFKKDMTDIGLKYRRRGITRKLYFISDSEEKNLRQALEMIESANTFYTTHESFSENASRTEFYVFADGRASEALLDSVPHGEMRVRRVCVNRNLALGLIEEHSVFADARPTEDGMREMNILIVGLGETGSELLRALAWCGQMKNYVLRIHAFDREEDIEDRLRFIAPDLVRYNRVRYTGEPYYDICFHGGIDVGSYTFLETLSEIPNITTAYVMLGDDERNLETAMALRTHFEREHMEKGTTVPPILPVIYSRQKRDVLLHGLGQQGSVPSAYGVYPIGDLESRYSLANVEMRELEEAGFAVHLGYYADSMAGKSEAEKAAIAAAARAEYERSEYCRRSSMAVAVHERARRAIGLSYGAEITEEDQLLEHCRWSAFMRAEGFVGSVHGKNAIAKTHGDLLPYDRLTAKEQRKDGVVLEARRTLRPKEDKYDT